MGSAACLASVAGVVLGGLAVPAAGATPLPTGCTIVGWGTVTGTEGDDVICLWTPIFAVTNHVDALGGNDVVYGTGHRDVIDGGPGDDTIYAGAGDDLVLGGPGDDIVHAGPGRDVVDGGPGDDHLDGGPGDDTLDGGRGDDHVLGGEGDDRLFGGEGADTIEGGDGQDRIYGDSQAPPEEWTWTSADMWWFTRYTGRDVAPPIPAWQFDPVPFRAYLATVVSGDELHGGPGDDMVFGELGADRVYGGPGDDLVRGGNDPHVEREWGIAPTGELSQAGDWGDWVSGDEGNDEVYGDGGVDLLFGGPGDDRLGGGAGYDALDGGAGTDICGAGGGVVTKCELVL